MRTEQENYTKKNNQSRPDSTEQAQGADSKRVTSIARRINLQVALQLLGRYLLMDILVLMVLFVVCGYCFDLQKMGEFRWDIYRTFYTEGGLDGVMYRAWETDGVTLYTISLGVWMKPMIIGGIVVVIAQLTEVLEQLVGGAKKIRKQLRPIREIAQKAQELSNLAYDSRNLTYDESRYHNLEDAISSLKVEKPNAHIDVQDKELQGIERAVNELLDRMRASYRQQTQFVSDASHELRTPIAVIQGYVNMLDRWGKEDEAILEESIEAIKNESTHMQKLVEQLLFLARGDSNRQKLEKKDVLLNDIMREVYEESVMIDEKHHYIFEEKGMAQMFGDADMIKQSARILIDNAAKYTPDGEEIVIRAGLWHGGEPYYCIQDNGIGMSDEDVSHAFDRFYRADAVRNSQTGGTGLGLAIARWIVEQHDGYYEVVSREEIGTRFNVIFPK